MSTIANTNGYVRASDGINGFDRDAWKTLLTNDQRIKLRHLRAKAGRGSMWSCCERR